MRLFKSIGIFLTILVLMLTVSVSALPAEQKRVIDSGAYYFNIEATNLTQCGTTLAGDDNEEKTWNYLISKGFTDIQAAGAMGNLQHEGNFNPKIVERGHMSGNTWVNGSPIQFPLDMETIPPSNLAPIVSGKYAGQPGYGIVQWTSPGRKDGLQAISDGDQANRPVYDLSLQLDYMWQELNNDYYKPRALDPLMAATTLEEAVRVWQDRYEVGRNFQPRMDAAQEWLTKFGSGGSAGGLSSSGGCGVSNIDGATCPTVMQPHPTRTGYFLFPEAPNGEYTRYSGDGSGPLVTEKQYGSEALVCTVYTVAIAFYNEMGGRSKLRIGDLNASGHASHNKGIGVDLSGFGELQVASHTASWKGTYDKEATILLGKMFADVGNLQNIWWCPPPGDDSLEQIKSYAQTKGLEGNVKCIAGHDNHFHVDIFREYSLEFWQP